MMPDLLTAEQRERIDGVNRAIARDCALSVVQATDRMTAAAKSIGIQMRAVGQIQTSLNRAMVAAAVLPSMLSWCGILTR